MTTSTLTSGPSTVATTAVASLSPQPGAAAAPPLAGSTVLVLGLGESGLAMARWCARCGAVVRVWDSRLDSAEPPSNAGALAQLVPGALAFGGALTAAALDGIGRLLKSPGLSPLDPRLALVLAAAATRGVAVQGELALFAEALAALRHGRGYAPKVVAITGTNGKTTTTAMAAKLIERSGFSVAMAGNIGPTMLQTLADALDRAGRGAGAEPRAVGPDTVAGAEASDPAGLPAAARTASDGSPASALPQAWVLELSSFQLADDTAGFEADAASVLNLSEDHLDWHGSMAAYAAAKARVFGSRATLVVNRDDAAVERLVAAVLPAAPAGRSATGRPRGAQAPALRELVCFGVGAPRRAGDWGLVDDNGIVWLARALPADEPSPRGRRGGAAGAGSDDAELRIQRLMPADALRVRGRHNAANALAALALSSAIGCRVAPMLHALRDYAGEPHRVQHVATIAGVDAFDDSKGTNVGATVAALAGLGADRELTRLVVILGGDGKGQDFAPLAEPVRRHVRAVATIGRDAAAIEAALAATGVPLARHASLQAATRWAFAQAEAGDAVLLSPACASLDMFRHYGHRAEVFVAEVLAIAAEHGEVVV